MIRLAEFARCKWSVGVAMLGVAVLIVCSGVRFNSTQALVAYALTAPSDGFANIVEKVKPSVISVRVKFVVSPRVVGDADTPSSQGAPLDRFLRRFFPNRPNNSPPPGNAVTGLASGFFITPDGYAVTNNHVVHNAENVRVFTDDGKTYAAKVVGTDSRTDLALIKIDGRPDFPYVKFAEDESRVGDWVLAIGNPFGLGGTVTAGIVSARGRDIGEGPYDDFIQIDAPVNEGNSGGPSFDLKGNVIGVNTAIVSPSGGSVGIGFAIPAELAKAVVTQLKAKGAVTRGFIGVQIQDVTAEIASDLGLKAARGALVDEPQANGPAAQAGIETGDVITAINGDEVEDVREFAKTISNMPPGASVNLTIIRNGKDEIINVTLGELPGDRRASVNLASQTPRGSGVAQFGLSVTPQIGEGVLVTDVDPNGIAAENGFKTGDVILEAGGKKVSNAGDILSAVRAAQKDDKTTVLMRVKSTEGPEYVTLPIGQS